MYRIAVDDRIIIVGDKLKNEIAEIVKELLNKDARVIKITKM